MNRYTIRIRRELAPVRPEAELVDGKTFTFMDGWEMDESDTAIYVGEKAMIPRDPDYPLEAPHWIAEGDLVLQRHG